MGVFKRSWEITKLSFSVVKQDKEMLIYPLLAGIFSIIFMIAMLFPTIISAFIEGMGMDQYGLLSYAMIFLTYLGLAFIATFFNVCVVYTAAFRFGGKNATFSSTLKYAFSKIHLIFAWSLVSATVGLILGIIDRIARQSGQVGKIVLSILNSLLGMVWSIVTIFVIPGMVYHDLGPFQAIKKSVEVLKKTWGESLIRHFGLGLIQFLFMILGIIIAIPLFILGISMGVYGVIAAIAVIVLYFTICILIFTVANSVFNTALFVYADTGIVPMGFDQEIMANAFKQKGKRF